MKVYQFLDENGKSLGNCRAENHGQAISMMSNQGINFQTDFYSFNVDDRVSRQTINKHRKSMAALRRSACGGMSYTD